MLGSKDKPIFTHYHTNDFFFQAKLKKIIRTKDKLNHNIWNCMSV